MDSADAGIDRWLAGITTGDEAAYRELVRELAPPLFRYAREVCGRDDLAEEAVQRTFIELYRMRNRLDARGSLRSLCFHIVRKRALDLRRDEGLRMRREDEGRRPDASGPDAAMAQALASELWAEVRTLEREVAEVLVLRFREGLSVPEVAAVLGLAEGTVKTRQRDGLEALKPRLQAHAALAAMPVVELLAQKVPHPLHVPGNLISRTEAVLMASIGGKKIGGVAVLAIGALLLVAGLTIGFVVMSGEPEHAPTKSSSLVTKDRASPDRAHDPLKSVSSSATDAPAPAPTSKGQASDPPATHAEKLSPDQAPKEDVSSTKELAHTEKPEPSSSEAKDFPRTGTIEVLVTTSSGKVVQGAKVLCRTLEPDAAPGQAVLRTNTFGSVRFEQPCQQWGYKLYVENPFDKWEDDILQGSSALPVEFSDVVQVLPLPDQVVQVTLKVIDGHWISGQAVSSDGHRCDGAELSISGVRILGNGWGNTSIGKVTCDTQGEFLAHIPQALIDEQKWNKFGVSGRWIASDGMIYVRDGSDKQKLLEWSPESMHELGEITLTAMAVVRGRVLVDGKPASGVEIRLQITYQGHAANLSNAADSEGAFSFERYLPDLSDVEAMQGLRTILYVAMPGGSYRRYDVTSTVRAREAITLDVSASEFGELEITTPAIQSGRVYILCLPKPEVTAASAHNQAREGEATTGQGGGMGAVDANAAINQPIFVTHVPIVAGQAKLRLLEGSYLMYATDEDEARYRNLRGTLITRPEQVEILGGNTLRRELDATKSAHLELRRASTTTTPEGQEQSFSIRIEPEEQALAMLLEGAFSLDTAEGSLSLLPGVKHRFTCTRWTQVSENDPRTTTKREVVLEALEPGATLTIDLDALFAE